MAPSEQNAPPPDGEAAHPSVGTCKPRRQLLTLPLTRRESLGEAYQLLHFDVKPEIAARAGQFAMLRGSTWGDSPLLARPMSILTAGERLSFLVKVVGEGTRRMARSRPGDVFTVLAPLGQPWSACPPTHRAVLVAGGVGVAPLLYLGRELAAAGAPRPVALYGARTRIDLPLGDEVEQVADLRVSTEDGSLGAHGRVTVLLDTALDELRDKGELAKVYCCGPLGMMAAVARICAARGVPCEVSLETPMGCGYGVCLGCNVPRAGEGYLYACAEGPCVDATTIDWSRLTPSPAGGTQ